MHQKQGEAGEALNGKQWLNKSWGELSCSRRNDVYPTPKTWGNSEIVIQNEKEQGPKLHIQLTEIAKNDDK